MLMAQQIAVGILLPETVKLTTQKWDLDSPRRLPPGKHGHMVVAMQGLVILL